MTIHLLSERDIRVAQPKTRAYTLRDGGSLYLVVQPNGSKLWRYRYRMGTKNCVFAIGKYPVVSLSKAREEHRQAKLLVQQGIHPIAERRRRRAEQLESNTHTFALVTQQWMASNPQWSTSYAAQVQRCMQQDVLPFIGKLPIKAVQASQLRQILLAVANRQAKTIAILIRQFLGQIFSYAQAHGLCDHQPASSLRGLVKRSPIRHHPPLRWNDIPDFFHKLDQWPGSRLIVLALRLLALTFVRTGELRLARWQEFDLAAGLWHLPAERMKMRRPHIVPLSRQALQLLSQLHELTGGCDRLFPKQHHIHAGPMGRNSMNRVIGCLGYANRFSAHGFRATATTMLGLLGYPEKQVDLQLAHRKQDSSRAPYDHTRFLQSRCRLMQDWADILSLLEQGATLEKVTTQFGPLSDRRTALLAVVQRE